MQTAFSDRSQPALQPGPGPGGRSGSSHGSSREAALGSSPGVMRNRGDCWGVLRVHTASSLPNEETEAEGVGRQPSPSPTHRPGACSRWHSASRHQPGGRTYPPTSGEAQRGHSPGHTVRQGQDQNSGPTVSHGLLGATVPVIWGNCFPPITVGALASFQGCLYPSPLEHNFCSSVLGFPLAY